MDLFSRSYNFAYFQSPPPPMAANQSLRSPSNSSNIPIIAVSVIGISAAAFVLVSYHVLVIKTCFNWHRVDVLRRFFLRRNHRREEISAFYSPAIRSGGLDAAAIDLIPTVRFSLELSRKSNSSDCPVCLSEFHDDEKVKRIPSCNHLFHIDCIDLWLQAHANCPLCRLDVSAQTRFDGLLDGEEDFVVLELGEGTIELPAGSAVQPAVMRKWGNGLSRSDEWIDTKRKKDRAWVEPIRRSISLDSFSNPMMIQWIQEEMAKESGPADGESSSRSGRSLFSVRHARSSSKGAGQPLHVDS